MSQHQQQHVPQPQTQYPFFIQPHPLLPQHQQGYPPQPKPLSANEDLPRFKLESKEPTLELLQSRFSRPLVDVAREFHVSLTMMKRLCRKLGIRRWPHRQIRSIDKLLADLEERAASTSSSREQEYLHEQIALFVKKRRLVTRGASSGMPGALRNALFMADPSTLLEEDDLFNDSKLGELEEALSTLTPSEQRKVMHKGETNPVLKIMTQANAKPALKRKRLKSSSKVENAVRALKEDKSGETQGDQTGINGGRADGNADGRPSVGPNMNMGWGSAEHSMSQMHQYPLPMGMWPWSYGEMMMQAGMNGNINQGMTMDPRHDMGYMYNPYHADPVTAAALYHHHQQMQHQMLGMNAGQVFPGSMPFVPTSQMESGTTPQEHPNFPPQSAYQNLAGLGMYRDAYSKAEGTSSDTQSNVQSPFFRAQAAAMMHMRQQHAAMTGMQLPLSAFPPQMWNPESLNNPAATVSQENAHAEKTTGLSNVHASQPASSPDSSVQQFLPDSVQNDNSNTSMKKVSTGGQDQMNSCKSTVEPDASVAPWSEDVANASNVMTAMASGEYIPQAPPHQENC